MKLIHGTKLTKEQIVALPFNGKTKSEWVKNHSFYFENGRPVEDMFPVCHSLSHLPH